MRTAFVLSGGGSLGAVQVGMLRALCERGIAPDLLVGTSAGALNAAYIAGDGYTSASLQRLADLWTGLRRRDVFPLQPVRHLRAMVGLSASLCTPHRLFSLAARHAAFPRLEDATIPLHVVATDILSGREVLLSTGDAVTAVVASAAIPGVLPPVERAGRVLADGGIADHAAVSQAIALGAERVVVLPAGYACALDEPPRTALASALHALSLLIEQRLVLEVSRFAQSVEVIVCPPLCPLSVSSADFSQAEALIDRAHLATGRWIDTGGPQLPHPERFLSLHRHHGGPRPGANDTSTDASLLPLAAGGRTGRVR